MSKGNLKGQMKLVDDLMGGKQQKQSPKLGHVSIFTDASMDIGFRVGGYAYQIIAPGHQPVKKWGGFEHQLHSIHEGELKAIAMAVHQLFYKLGAPDKLTIYSDSIAALDMLDDSEGHEAYRELFDWVREEIKKRKLKTLSLKHVPAHTKADIGKLKLNAWCDKYAKKGMRLRKKQWKKGKKPDND